MTIIKGKPKVIGINEIDTDLVVENWNHLWSIAEWRGEWRVIKFVRKDSPLVEVKTAISRDQAYELIERLDLTPYDSCFSSGRSWRKYIVEPNNTTK